MRSRVAIGALLVSLGLSAGCTRTTDGIEVDIAYQTPPTPQALRTDMGYRVWLDRALIVLGPVELIRCDNFARALWRLFTVSRAKAHTPTTPTSLGIPLVLDLLESGGIGFVVGTIRPPPGRYCGLRVIGAPADADAVGIKNNDEMLDRSVLLTGDIEDGESLVRTPFEVSIQDSLPNELVFTEPLVFDSPRLVNVSIQIDHMRWFDGIDFAQVAPGDAGSAAVQRRVAENIRDSMAAESQ
ncbi:MAG: hypothetical protein AAGF92_10555 [Myxococcota bacterium]